MAGTAEEWPSAGLIFSTSGGKRYTAHSKGKEQLDRILAADGYPAMKPWRLHDLRRTLATDFQQMGVRFEVTEAVLNHLSGSKPGLGGTYRTYDWAPEKRDALDAWAVRVRALVLGDDVVGQPPAVSDLETAFLAGMKVGHARGKLAQQS